MLGVLGRRFFHTSQTHFTTARSSALAKLRKSTGYSVSNCKQAVELFPDDIAKAEEWLHAEAKQKGWSKWAKVQTRSATQGLVGVFSTDKVGVMLEVNCETDFVAKNVEFHHFVENVLSGCMNHICALPAAEEITKTVLDESQLNGIKFKSSTLGELIIDAFTKFNEKTVLKRAVCYKVKDNINLSSVSHPSISCPNLNGATLGKYGTILAYKNSNPEQDVDKELSLNICNHIIGMNPLSIGQLSEKDILRFNKTLTPEAEEIVVPNLEVQDAKSEDAAEKPTGDAETTAEKPTGDAETTAEKPTGDAETTAEELENVVEGQETLDANIKDTDETRLLFQDFLLDSNVSVGETLYKSGVEIIDFERFQCGEIQAEETKQQSVSL